MKKILGLMANIGFGGAEVQSVLLFNGLCKKGYTVKVIVLDSIRVQLAQRLDKSIAVEFIKRYAYFDPAAVIKVERHLAEFDPDFFIMVDNYPTLYGILLKKLFRMRTDNLTIIHNTVPPNIKRALQNRFIYAPSINRLNRVVFVSSRQKQYWMERYGILADKASVILNGIDFEYFDQFYQSHTPGECRDVFGIPRDCAVIVMNASLWPAKSHEHMLEAVHALRKEGQKLYLLLIGDGPRRAFLEKLAAEKGLAGHMRITGYVSDVRPYLMCADVSALTSVSVETLSLAALESMALGKALILSDTGGAAEIVEHGVNGYLYTPGNIEELTNCIRNILKDERCRRMGDEARSKAVSLFTCERMVDEYVRLLEDSRTLRTAVSAEMINKKRDAVIEYIHENRRAEEAGCQKH